MLIKLHLLLAMKSAFIPHDPAHLQALQFRNSESPSEAKTQINALVPYVNVESRPT
jgi:hypothetical protein